MLSKISLVLVSLVLFASVIYDANASSRALQSLVKHQGDQKRIALVIGNGNYQDAPKLANPVTMPEQWP
jgi:hypothetical protein